MKEFIVLVPEAFLHGSSQLTATPEGVRVEAGTPEEAMDLVTGPGEGPSEGLLVKEIQPGLWLVTDPWLGCNVFVVEGL